jgi:hypothetical protein
MGSSLNCAATRTPLEREAIAIATHHGNKSGVKSLSLYHFPGDQCSRSNTTSPRVASPLTSFMARLKQNSVELGPASRLIGDESDHLPG